MVQRCEKEAIACYFLISGAHEPPKAAKERVTREYSRVPSKYKSVVVMTSIFGKLKLILTLRDAIQCT